MAIFTYEYTTRYTDVGSDNKLTLKALVATLQQAAISHSEEAGSGVSTIDQTHLAWLLLDWKVQVISYPNSNETLTVKTWPRVFDKLYSYRDFEVFDKDNNLIAVAASKWFAIDTESKKIRKLTPEITAAYGEPVTKCVFENAFQEKLKVPEDLKLNFNYEIQRRDIDTNGHVNNLNYIDFALETLCEKVYNNNTFHNLEVIYKKEIKLHEKINCYYSFENNKNVVTIKNQNNETIHSVIKLY